MLENFDATQFLSFDLQDNIKKRELFNEIQKRFEDFGFKVFFENEIRPIKVKYFQKYRSEIFIELFNQTFGSELEGSWKDEKNPPEVFVRFSKLIKWVASIRGVSNVKVIICSFAEENNYSSIEIIQTTKDTLLNAFYKMSINCFDTWVDNLIIEIRD